MKNVFFKPYVGSNYFEKGFLGKKLLVLGESHICGLCERCGDITFDGNISSPRGKASDCRVFTSIVVNAFLKYKNEMEGYERWMNTFTKFSNVLYNDQIDKEILNEFWSSIVFYNYVQFTTPNPGISPKNKEFINSEVAFFEILEEFSPDLIIVWGARLEGYLPKKNKTLSDFEIFNEGGHRLHYYEFTGKKIPAYAIYHPSIPKFSYDYHDFLKEVLRISGFDISLLN